MLADEFADLREMAYFRAEISAENSPPMMAQLSTPRLQHQRQSNRATKVAA